MKNILILSITLLTLISCMKETDQNKLEPFDPEKQSQTDDSLIREYLSTNNIEAIKHESGLYHTTENKVNSSYPSSNSNVEVYYKGYLLNGFVFDQSLETSISFTLDQVILGWQIGIPLIPYGGSGILFIPSALGYGQASAGSIPPNSVLIFEIELTEID